MRNLIHTLISSRTDFVVTGQFLAADSDRYVNIFDPKGESCGHLVNGEGSVITITLFAVR